MVSFRSAVPGRYPKHNELGATFGGMASQLRPSASLSRRQCLHLFPSVNGTLELNLGSTVIVRRIPRCNWVARASCRPIPISNIFGRWLSHFISFYLLCLNLVAEVHEYPTPPSAFACEDISSYYAHVENLRGGALKKKLNSIVAPHHSLSYKEVWKALKILDAADVDKPEASPAVVEIYSLRKAPKHLSGKPEGWNREHLWPRSYGLTNGPSLTDLHNIRPADVNVNASRGNKYYGECKANSKKCFKPANKEAAFDTETDKESWAPPRQVRGDVARALMYMAVCYGYYQPGGGPGLRLSDTPNIGKREMGLLSTLLKWNEIDPPSREEKLRNERICKLYQHNRNPFVDYPEYANLIWKPIISRRATNNDVSSHNKKAQRS